MQNALVIIPAGEVYNRDCVRWFSHYDAEKKLTTYHNVGDSVVYDSSLKLLDFGRLTVAKIHEVLPADIDRYNSEYHYCFLRGSNYVHATMNWERAAEVLDRLRMPILAFGIGAQAPSTGRLTLSPETRRVLDIISHKSTTIGVRGRYTAEVLWDLGIKNVRIIGCPTVFRHRNPELRIALPPLGTLRDVCFTLRREVDRFYARDIAAYLAVQRRTILDLAERFHLEILAQGETEEKKILLGSDTQKREAIQYLIGQGWFTGLDDPLLAMYQHRMFYSDVVSAYEQFLRGKDLVLGYRLHGNLMALANGVPAIYFTYDSRTTEFVETFQIPHFSVFSGRAFALEEYYRQADFERFNRAYHYQYREMVRFLDENGIEHRLPAAEPARSAHAA